MAVRTMLGDPRYTRRGAGLHTTSVTSVSSVSGTHACTHAATNTVTTVSARPPRGDGVMANLVRGELPPARTILKLGMMFVSIWRDFREGSVQLSCRVANRDPKTL